MLLNDFSLRSLIPNELAKGFGFFQCKPRERVLARGGHAGRARRRLAGRQAAPAASLRDQRQELGQPDAGVDMTFDFGRLIAHAAKTRPLAAGTIIGSGTVSNADRSVGSSCLAEMRTIETIEKGKAETPFLRFGDRVRIEMLDGDGRSIFGAIEQQVVRYRPPRP